MEFDDPRHTRRGILVGLIVAAMVTMAVLGAWHAKRGPFRPDPESETHSAQQTAPPAAPGTQPLQSTAASGETNCGAGFWLDGTMFSVLPIRLGMEADITAFCEWLPDKRNARVHAEVTQPDGTVRRLDLTWIEPPPEVAAETRARLGVWDVQWTPEHQGDYSITVYVNDGLVAELVLRVVGG